MLFGVDLSFLIILKKQYIIYYTPTIKFIFVIFAKFAIELYQYLCLKIAIQKPMKLKKMLYLTPTQLKQLYRKELPYLCEIALNSNSDNQFCEMLENYLDAHYDKNNSAIDQIYTLIKFNNKQIFELSTEQELNITTMSLLRDFLRTDSSNGISSIDLFVDIFYLFNLIDKTEVDSVVPKPIESFMKRWASGLDKRVKEIRRENKDRILHLLVQKIETRKQSSSRFSFEEGISYDQKLERVSEWWNDFRFHLSTAVKSPTELNRFLGNSLSSETLYLLSRAKKKGIPFFITPYYLSLLNVTKDGYDDSAIRSYVLYSPGLVETYGNITAWEKEDNVKVDEPNAAGWLLPEGHNIHRRYPEVAILIPDTMGRACGGLCASCQRMYDFQSKRLNFEFESLKPKESWDKKLGRLMDYFENDAQLQDILITGGDALMSQNKTLKNILNAVLRMAIRKRKANLLRPDGQKYAELQRIRLGSRLLAYLPMRIDDELVQILSEFRDKATKYGIKQFIIQTHFQTPLEVTEEAAKTIKQVLSSGWIITNQLVYNVAASRRGHTCRLRQVLNRLGVLTYYTFSVKGFAENYNVFTPISRSIQEQMEEKIYGKLTASQTDELSEVVATNRSTSYSISQFLKKHKLPFLATDRNVLNLPAIGKSSTFKLVGITDKGKRILEFHHDTTRKHSPIIDNMQNVYIVENKSITSYLKEIDSMSENVDDYSSIWKYTQSNTEPRFKLYEYPEFEYSNTKEINNYCK